MSLACGLHPCRQQDVKRIPPGLVGPGSGWHARQKMEKKAYLRASSTRHLCSPPLALPTDFLENFYLNQHVSKHLMEPPSIWQHMLSWWHLRSDPSVLWLFYEDMLEHNEEVVRLIAGSGGCGAIKFWGRCRGRQLRQRGEGSNRGGAGRRSEASPDVDQGGVKQQVQQ